jgi:chromate transporter
MKSRKPKWKLIAQIFVTFLKIGPVTFGGGYAMIPLIEREVVVNRKWITTKDIANIFAVSESIPGAIAINSSTFIGYRVAGPLGALVALIGVLLPTFCIVILLSIFFLQFQDHPKIEAAFVSIRATIVALITYAAYKIGRTALIDVTTLLLILITVLTMVFWHIHPIAIILGGALAGMAIVYLKLRLGMKTKLDHEDVPTYQTEDQYIGGGI